MNRTKIVATIGPASITQRVLFDMVRSGLDVCRLNFSHGDYKWHKKAVENIRAVEKKSKKKIGIIADIQGPRIRIANRKEVVLKKNERIFITDQESPPHHRYKKEIILDWDGFYEFIKRESIVFIEDGLIQLKITALTKHGCVGEVLVPGVVKSHKGVNIPSISSHLGFLTEKDLADLEFIVSQNVDFVAASFVASAKDIQSLRQIISHFQETSVSKNKQVNSPWIISKIERRKAIKNIKEIIKESDGIMVARGDLAIETPQEKVAVLQKDIIKQCLKKQKPVIVATQMMASMVKSARPTRAEISDVTNAVVDSADAVMLSNETAAGEYPVETVATMDKVIKEAEKSSYDDRVLISRNKFARVLMRHKRKRKQTLKVKDLEELKAFSSLRQEKIKLSLSGRKLGNRRKATLIWAAK